MPVSNQIGQMLSHSSVEEIAENLNKVVKQVFLLIDEAKRNEEATKKMLPEKVIDRSFYMGQIRGMIESMEILCKTMGINLKMKD